MRARAIIVDDSLTVRMDLRAALSKAGFLVVACSTKAMAWTTLKSGGFNLAVLDIQLPDGNGIDLLNKIKSDPELCSIPTILLTTETEVETRLQGLACGADRYIGKPYDRDSLVHVAKELCMMAEPVPVPSSRRELPGKKILVVDDSPTFAQAAAQQLRRDRHEVVLARSGEEALALLAVEPFACVLLDLTLPGIDGLETCRRLRQQPGGREVLVLAVTASESPSLRQDTLMAGFDEVALKTPTLELLQVRVRSLLFSRRSGTEASRTPRPALVEAELDAAGFSPHVERH